MPRYIVVKESGAGWGSLPGDGAYFNSVDAARDYARQTIEDVPGLVLSIAKVVKRLSSTVSVKEADVE